MAAPPTLPDRRVPSATNHGCVLDKDLTHPHRPMPDPATGYLTVDPEIQLKTKGFDLNIEFYYSSRSIFSGVYGANRSASFNASATTFASYTEVVRGDGSQIVYVPAGSSGGVTYFTPYTTTPNAASLTFSGSTYTETFPDGTKLNYVQPPGTSSSYMLSSVASPNQGTHTYLYGSGGNTGLLMNIQDRRDDR